jgi:hypothetical protein
VQVGFHQIEFHLDGASLVRLGLVNLLIPGVLGAPRKIEFFPIMPTSSSGLWRVAQPPATINRDSLRSNNLKVFMSKEKYYAFVKTWDSDAWGLEILQNIKK